uniref:RING-type domain-containing protein n=1 Tax=Amphilophus citrinellus TaxID=61819 RepID=A0A3Q0QQU8_AMPCI
MRRLKKKNRVCEEERPSCCASCQDVLKDPVSTSCGHWFCRQCISSYWDQSASSGDSSCPQCGQRSRTTAGLQTAKVPAEQCRTWLPYSEVMIKDLHPDPQLFIVLFACHEQIIIIITVM